jgi:Zn-dependent protease
MSHSLLAQKMGHPVKGITLFVFGGVSEIEEEAHTPSAEFWIAVIGPFSSFFLSAFFFLLNFFTRNLSDELAAVFQRLAAINLALGIFNLLPAFPLDGGRVLRSILWKSYGSLRRATRIAGRTGQYFGYLMIVLGIMIAFGSGRFLNGLWIAFIGWFLTSAAESSVQQGELIQVLQRWRAKDVMSRDCSLVPGNLNLEDLVEKQILPSGNRCFLVTEEDRLAGMISIHEIKQVPRPLWSHTLVKDAMKPVRDLKIASPEMQMEQVLRIMDDEKVNQLPVLSGQTLVGIITREHVLNMIRTRIAFENE